MQKTAKWEARREGNQGYIRETLPSGEVNVYIVPSHLVPAVIAARRKLTQAMMEANGHKLTDDSDFDPSLFTDPTGRPQ